MNDLEGNILIIISSVIGLACSLIHTVNISKPLVLIMTILRMIWNIYFVPKHQLVVALFFNVLNVVLIIVSLIHHNYKSNKKIYTSDNDESQV